MEAQSHDRHQHYEEDPHHDIAGLHSGEGEHNQDGEKKSVLKKVKDKAKKIKDTIKKHGHEHEYRHDQISEEEDDEDMVNVPEVHGAPMYESPVIPGTNLPIQTDVHKVRNIEVYPNVEDEGISIRPPGPAGKMGTELERSSVDARRTEFENLLPQSSSPDATFVKEANVAEPTVQISPLIGLEEDPHSPNIHPGKIPPSNYQSKVTDPTGEGGKKAEVAPLLQRLDNFHIHDQSESNPIPEQKSFTESHDQFAPQSTSTVDQFIPESNPVNPSEKPDHESMPRDTIAGKISSATSAVADKVISAKDTVASKLGYGGQPQDGDVSSKKPVTELTTEYGHKVAEKFAQVYDKVAGAGSAVISNVQGGGDTVAKGNERGVSVKEYLAEKMRPGEEDKALSEAISGIFYKKKEGMRGKEEEVQPVEPEEVAACSVTAKEATGSESSGRGVVDRLKGAVGSWIGKSSGTRSSHHSLGQSHVSGAGSVPTIVVGQGK